MSDDDTEDTTVTRRLLPSPVKMEGFLLMMKCKHLIEILWEEHLFTLWGITSVSLFGVFSFESVTILNIYFMFICAELFEKCNGYPAKSL